MSLGNRRKSYEECRARLQEGGGCSRRATQRLRGGGLALYFLCDFSAFRIGRFGRFPAAFLLRFSRKFVKVELGERRARSAFASFRAFRTFKSLRIFETSRMFKTFRTFASAFLPDSAKQRGKRSAAIRIASRKLK